jgi:hypothetical protein
MTAPWGGVLVAGPAAATTDVDDVNGGPLEGSWWLVRQWPPPKLKTSVTAPWGVLAAGPATTTAKVEDVDGGPPRGCCRYLRQWPPPVLIRDP